MMIVPWIPSPVGFRANTSFFGSKTCYIWLLKNFGSTYKYSNSIRVRLTTGLRWHVMQTDAPIFPLDEMRALVTASAINLQRNAHC